VTFHSKSEKVGEVPSPYEILYYTPHAMALIFLVFLYATKIPAKAQFFWRAVVALAIVTLLAHVNRIFHLYPAYLYFPSGHMTFCLGLSISLAMLRRWTLVITLPFLIIFGEELVAYDCHTVLDVLGAIPLVLIVYGIVHYVWSIPSATPLDTTKVST
jgi:signal transduction histidine kinase